jgi:HEAT repeat protein
MKKIMNYGGMLVFFLLLATVALADENEKYAYHQYLLTSLNDENVGCRASAAMLLGENGVQAAIEPLMKMMRTEKDYRVRIIALVSLHKMANPSIVPQLNEMMKKEKNKTVKHVLAGVIKELSTQEIVLMK